MVKEPLSRLPLQNSRSLKGLASQIYTSLLADLVQAHAFVFISLRVVNLLTVLQYADSVVGPGSNFNDAYFEISYIRAYTTGAPAPTPNALVSISTSAPTALPTSLLAPSKPTASSLFFPGSAEGRQANMMGAIAAILMVGFFNLCL